MKIYKTAQTVEQVKDPNCPPEALAEVLRRGNDDWVSYCASQNPNCPPEALAEVLRRGNNDWASIFNRVNLIG